MSEQQSTLAMLKATAEKISDHAWLARFRQANYANKWHELSPTAVNDIAEIVDHLISLAKATCEELEASRLAQVESDAETMKSVLDIAVTLPPGTTYRAPPSIPETQEQPVRYRNGIPVYPAGSTFAITSDGLEYVDPGIVRGELPDNVKDALAETFKEHGIEPRTSMIEMAHKAEFEITEADAAVIRDALENGAMRLKVSLDDADLRIEDGSRYTPVMHNDEEVGYSYDLPEHIQQGIDDISKSRPLTGFPVEFAAQVARIKKFKTKQESSQVPAPHSCAACHEPFEDDGSLKTLMRHEGMWLCYPCRNEMDEPRGVSSSPIPPEIQSEVSRMMLEAEQAKSTELAKTAFVAIAGLLILGGLLIAASLLLYFGGVKS